MKQNFDKKLTTNLLFIIRSRVTEIVSIVNVSISKVLYKTRPY